MDVLFFLKERTKFIQRYYSIAAEPFFETKRKIEAEEAPFDDPPYSEDGEPAFLVEWLDADVSLEVLGRSCVSMLSAALQLYFATWERELGLVWKEEERKKAFKKGYLSGYRIGFGEVLNISWSECPVDFDILEQVTLTRNRDQHPEHITSLDIRHRYSDSQKFKQLFFARDHERGFADSEMADNSWMTPSIHVSLEALFAAIKQVELLAEWLEEKMFAVKYPRRNSSV